MNCYHIWYAYRVKYKIKGIWWQMKFGEIFWGEVKRGRGIQGKKDTIILFSRCQIVKATSGYYK